jgi:hypothetical protein
MMIENEWVHLDDALGLRNKLCEAAEVEVIVAIAGFPSDVAAALIARQIPARQVAEMFRDCLSRPRA